jgi:hypothetical protein
MTMNLVTQPTAALTRKMKGVTLAGGLTVALVAVINYYTPGLGDTLAPTITALLTYVAAVVNGYMLRERA